ncbi:MAG: VWA domain-containing protein [Acidobacteriota bacterium]
MHRHATARRPSRLGSALCAALLAAVLAGPAGAQTSVPSAPLPGNESQPPAAPTGIFTEEVSVRVINVDVIVTDRSGQAVAGLGRNDFELRLDGKPVPISNFYSEAGKLARRSGRPPGERRRDPSFQTLEGVKAGSTRRSHVVILVDHTRLRATNRKRAFTALRQAVDRLAEDDLVSVVGVEGSLVFYSDFLFDRQGVHQILDDVSRVATKTEVNEFERRQILGELTRGMSGGILGRTTLADDQALISRIRAYATEEYARGVRSLQQIERVVATLSGVPGRKTLLYLGEGIPTRPGEGLYVEFRNRFAGSFRGLPQQDFNADYTREVGRYDLTQPMRQLASAANRANVTLYAIDAEGSHGGDLRSALTEQGATSEAVSVVSENYREPLEFASKATGGRLLQSSGKLADQLVDLAVGLRTFYSLGFTPPAEWQPGSDHKLEVKIKAKNLVVNYRQEVRLPEADEREAGATVAALMYQTVDNPLEIRAKPGFEVPRQDGTAALPVNLEIPIKSLGFLPQGGAKACSLTIYVSIKNKEGNPGKIQKIPFHLAIPDDKMEEALADSAHYPLPLVLRPGDRQVAIGIRDHVNGLFSAVRLDVAQYSQF